MNLQYFTFQLSPISNAATNFKSKITSLQIAQDTHIRIKSKPQGQHMAAGLNLNKPPSEGDEEDGLLDLNEMPTIGVQQQFEANIHGGGSQDNFPFDLNLLQPEEHMQTC
jgi:hypothetical protein